GVAVGPVAPVVPAHGLAVLEHAALDDAAKVVDRNGRGARLGAGLDAANDERQCRRVAGTVRILDQVGEYVRAHLARREVGEPPVRPIRVAAVAVDLERSPETGNGLADAARRDGARTAGNDARELQWIPVGIVVRCLARAS